MSAVHLWPSAPSEVLAGAHLIAGWAAGTAGATILAPRRPLVRALVAGLPPMLMACVLGFTPRRLLAGALLAGIAVVSQRQSVITRRRNLAWCAEFMYLLAALAIARVGATGGLRTWFLLPFTPMQIATLFACGSALLFTAVAGARVVESVLLVAHALPPERSDASEANAEHGWIIGALERILVLLTVAGGHLDVLGFLIAAKGLIRSKDFESRERAEYILVGTLTSVGLALVFGLLVGAMWRQAWPEQPQEVRIIPTSSISPGRP